MRRILLSFAVGLLFGCGHESSTQGDGAVSQDDGPAAHDDASVPPEDGGRDIVLTDLSLDLASLTARATITLSGSTTSQSASFEIGDLALTAVRDLGGQPLDHVISDGPPRRVDVTIPPSADPAQVTFEYTFSSHTGTATNWPADFDGWMASHGVTFLWPYACGNLFPCRSTPAEGTTFTASVTGVPDGQIAVYPAVIATAAPSYMFAVAVGSYEYHEIGVTTAGTQVGVYAFQGSTGWEAATAGMRDIFDWYETTLGAYAYGNRVASVEVDWGPGPDGAQEHHPFWHVATGLAMSLEYVHAHEAAHGWYGNGVRMRCWEDFVLSEGTTTYVTFQMLAELRGWDSIWDAYSLELDVAIAQRDTVAYPSTCNVVDMLNDPLASDIPYQKGALFYKAVADQIGVDALKGVLRQFYLDHVGGAATMQDMLDAIQSQTGFDPTDLANGWLRSLGRP